MNQYTLYIRLYNYIGSLIDKYSNDHSNATGRWDIEHMFRPPTVLTRLNNEKSSFPFTEELLSLLNYVLFQQLGSLLYSSLAHICSLNNREFGVIKLRQTYVGTLNGLWKPKFWTVGRGPLDEHENIPNIYFHLRLVSPGKLV